MSTKLEINPIGQVNGLLLKKVSTTTSKASTWKEPAEITSLLLSRSRLLLIISHSDTTSQ